MPEGTVCVYEARCELLHCPDPRIPSCIDTCHGDAHLVSGALLLPRGGWLAVLLGFSLCRASRTQLQWLRLPALLWLPLHPLPALGSPQLHPKLPSLSSLEMLVHTELQVLISSPAAQGHVPSPLIWASLSFCGLNVTCSLADGPSLYPGVLKEGVRELILTEDEKESVMGKVLPLCPSFPQPQRDHGEHGKQLRF